MFFPDKIVSIKETDKVLEVGPGGTPYHRSNVLLEKIFNKDDANEQRGHAKPLQTKKKIVFYEGNTFPFEDNEFDYVICSHVLEHITSNEIKRFVSELQRVSTRGYLEFPTIYYDYIYNFPKHLTFLLYKNGVIKYLGKEKTQLNLFSPVQKFFYNSANAGHTCLTQSLKNYYFQGFEWYGKIQLKEVHKIQDIVYSDNISNNITKALPQNISCKQKIKNKIKEKLACFKKQVLLHVLRDRFLNAHKKWVNDQGDKTLRLDYDLAPDSVVFDLGGYEGDFAQNIYDKYGCTIYIFEPVKKFYENIIKRFDNNKKVQVFNFGLSDASGEVEINMSADGTSVFVDSANKETIILKDIVLFLDKEKLQKIDLMKINIEGGEFQVVSALIKNNLIKNIINLQVQFHIFIKDAESRRDEIRSKFKQTHKLTYDYWFVWENWKLKHK